MTMSEIRRLRQPRAKLYRSSVRIGHDVNDTNLDGFFGLSITSVPTEQQLLEITALFPNLSQLCFVETPDILHHWAGRQWRLSINDGALTAINLYAEVRMNFPQDDNDAFWQAALQLPRLGYGEHAVRIEFLLEFETLSATNVPLVEWSLSTSKIPAGLKTLMIQTPLPLSDILNWWKDRGSKINTALRHLTHDAAEWDISSLRTLLSLMPQLESLDLIDNREASPACPTLGVLPSLFEQLGRSLNELRKLRLQFNNSLYCIHKGCPAVLASTGPIGLHRLDIPVEASLLPGEIWWLATLFATSLSDDCECTLSIIDDSDPDGQDDFVECLRGLRSYVKPGWCTCSC